MEWKIRRGNDITCMVNFRGKGGQVRPIRKDELVISNVEVEDEADIGIVRCNYVIGRKAWRVGDEGQDFIDSMVAKLNANEITPLELLEALERKFEGGMNG